MGRQPPTRQQVAAALTAIAVLLGGGTGAGYALHGNAAEASQGAPDRAGERLTTLEQKEAARAALEARDRQERAEWVQALKDTSATNSALREAVVALTERMGAIASTQASMDARLRTVEANGVRPASWKRP